VKYTHNGDTNSALLASTTRLNPTRSTVNNAQTRSDQPIPSNVPSGLETRSPVPPQPRISTKRRVGSRSCVLSVLKISSQAPTLPLFTDALQALRMMNPELSMWLKRLRLTAIKDLNERFRWCKLDSGGSRWFRGSGC